MDASPTSYAKTLSLPDGSMLELRDTSDSSKRNVYHLSSDGAVLWQIADFPRPHPQSFVDIYFKSDGTFWAYNFNGWEYQVDLASGAIVARDFLH